MVLGNQGTKGKYRGDQGTTDLGNTGTQSSQNVNLFIYEVH